MQTSSIFTRQKMGIDNNVWLTMLVFVILSAGLFSYNVINHKSENPCKTNIDIFVNGRINAGAASLTAGQPVTFRSSTSGDKITWDFGDESKKDEGFSAVHVYTRNGFFTITATVNDRCNYFKKVNIEPVSQVVTDTAGNTLESIVGKEEGKVGEKITFSTTLPASSYEWSIENNRHYPVKNGKQATYEFKSQATYTVILMLDHDSKRIFKKTVAVSSSAEPKNDIVIPGPLIPLPPKIEPKEPEKKDTVKAIPEPVKKVYRYVSDEILKTYLQSIVCKEMKPEQFDEYLCNGLNTTVIVNNKERKTFAQVCGEIQDKKIKIESAKGGRNPGENCINIITVEYDKKGWLGRNPCKN